MLGQQPVSNRDRSHHPGQSESLRSCRAWVEQERVAEPFVLWLMGVTEDTDVWPGAIKKTLPIFGQLSGFKYDMPDRDSKPFSSMIASVGNPLSS